MKYQKDKSVCFLKKISPSIYIRQKHGALAHERDEVEALRQSILCRSEKGAAIGKVLQENRQVNSCMVCLKSNNALEVRDDERLSKRHVSKKPMDTICEKA